MDTIALTTLNDLLQVESDDHFEKILQELPATLCALRSSSRFDGHAGVDWPLRWRPDGGGSSITTHCSDGAVQRTLPPAPVLDDGKFDALRAAVRSFLAQPTVPVGSVLVEYRNATSVLVIAQLLNEYDKALNTIAHWTEEGPLGALTADEVELIRMLRSVDESGRDFIRTAAESVASVQKEAVRTSADIIDIRPRT